MTKIIYFSILNYSCLSSAIYGSTEKTNSCYEIVKIFDGAFETNKKDPSEEKEEEMKDRREYLVDYWQDIYGDPFLDNKSEENQNHKENESSSN